jgi:diguanylate cyclase
VTKTSSPSNLAPFLESVVDRINIGLFIINANMEVVLWNHFMEVNSGQTADTIIGRNLFDCFPDLPRSVVENKIKSVFILKNFAFSSWEQRSYLFKFRHNRPVTGGVAYMYQDYTFIPIKNEQGEVEKVCVTLVDVTDTAIYQKMLKEALESLAEANHRDGLTGIYNRHFLEESLAREFSRARRYGGTISLVMLDIDNFKIINDTFGHLAGDEVLRSTAKHLNTVLRQTDILGRYGGEEFSLLLPETNLKGAQILADRVREQIEQASVPYGSSSLNVTISAGIAEYHAGMTRHEDLIKAADDALYLAKESGRNLVICA